MADIGQPVNHHILVSLEGFLYLPTLCTNVKVHLAGYLDNTLPVIIIIMSPIVIMMIIGDNKMSLQLATVTWLGFLTTPSLEPRKT